MDGGHVLEGFRGQILIVECETEILFQRAAQMEADLLKRASRVQA